MTGAPIEVIGALSLAGVAAAMLLLCLVITGVILHRISVRLVALQAVLHSIADATDPLTARVFGIAGNVRNLRAAAVELNGVVASRATGGN